MMSCFQSSCPFRCDRGDSLQLRGRRALTKLGETLSPSFACAKTCHLRPPTWPKIMDRPVSFESILHCSFQPPRQVIPTTDTCLTPATTIADNEEPSVSISYDIAHPRDNPPDSQ